MASTNEFCTLFDSNYLLKGLALYESLRAHVPDARLTVYAFDTVAAELLQALALPGLEVVPLRDLERADPELRSVKDDRTVGEYCWTATPALPLNIFDRRPDLDAVTYVDADLWFFSDPAPLFSEMGDASVLMTPHRFSRQYRGQEKAGHFNVQFLRFVRDERGLAVLRWWHDRCVEWCYARLEDGRFGDQKYLDEWPERFEGVHVLEHHGGGLAPWNLRDATVERREDGTVAVDGEPLVFFHFHGLVLRTDGRNELYPPIYWATPEERELIYAPYLDALDRALSKVRSVAPEFAAGLEPPPTALHRLRREVRLLAARAGI